MRLCLIANPERGAQTPDILYSYDQKAGLLGHPTVGGINNRRSARHGAFPVTAPAPESCIRFVRLTPWRGVAPAACPVNRSGDFDVRVANCI